MYRVTPVEFVVAVQTVVDESHRTPAVKGHWMVCGGFPAIDTREFKMRDPMLKSMVAAILTIARVSWLYQISAGCVKVKLPNLNVRVAATWYVE
jgi:hypothetical protein